MTNASRLAALTMFVGLVGAAASSAMAAEPKDNAWQKTHPRREQVNHRLALQNQRIRTEVKEGDLTRPQAAALHRDDRQIRREERLMARQHGSHITKLEQKTLNQQQSAVSHQIGS